MFAFAPSADASRGTLREVGFENADTIARLLVDKQLQESIKGELIWIDEAGLLGTRTMSQVFDLADRLDARVILSGDRRQHGSVERGAALRLLETEAGLVPAEIKEIQRQRGAYKEAMHELSEGNLEEGFRQIDQLGWIREAPPEERYRLLAEDYVKSVQAGETALVVSPTHLEGERITGEIRTALQKVGSVDAEQHLVRRLESLNLTEAERADVVNYAPGDVIEFHQNAKGFEKGQQLEVGDTPLPFDQARRFQAYHAGDIALAAGDVIRITKNGQTLDKQHRLNNGSLYRVKGFDTRGNLQLDNGWIIAKNFGHLTYGYVVTSHASQGKTVDHVFIGQSSASWGASSREQFYVSASRGRKQVSIYTDDKASLLKSVNQTDPRLTATELVTPQQIRRKGKTLRRQELLNSVYVPMNLVSQRTKDFSHDDRTNR